MADLLESFMSNQKSDSLNRRLLRPICLKNNPAKFHPDPISNDGDLSAFLKSVAPTRTTRWVAILDQLLTQKWFYQWLLSPNF